MKYDIKFIISEKDCLKFVKWVKKHNKSCTYIKKCSNGIGDVTGTRFTFCFTPTGLGTITKIKCPCGEELDLTDYNL